MSLAGSGPGPVQVPFASQLLAPPRAVTWLNASYLGPGGTPPPSLKTWGAVWQHEPLN